MYQENVDRNMSLLLDNISRINDISDINVEVTKLGMIKITLLIGEPSKFKILIFSKSIEDEDNLVIYTYFINRSLIASDVVNIVDFIDVFNIYIQVMFKK